MMRRLCARTKSFTNVLFLLFVIGAVYYVSYSSTFVKDRVMQKQTKSKSTKVTSPQEAIEIIIDHQKSEILANIQSKLFDQQHWKDVHFKVSTTVQKDLQFQHLDSLLSQSNTIKPTLKSFSPISWQKLNTRTSFPTRDLIENSLKTKNERAAPDAIKTFQLKKVSPSAKPVSRGNAIVVEPTREILSLPSKQNASTQTFSPTNFEVIKNYSTMKLGGLVKPLVKKPSSVETAKQKENVDLFIAIFSAPQRFDRRAVLRDTWISSISNYSVAFKFFTDGKELSNETKTMLSKEQDEFGDVEMLPTKGGYWFSHRFLHALFWAHHHYNFSYFLRLDDDYFICLHHLYHDLLHRKKEKFLYWGSLWCQKEIVRMDESFVLLGADLTEEIIRRNESLYCHPFGDQMIEMWFSRLKIEGIKVKYFPDNARILQFGLRPYQPSQNMCQDLLGIHKTYPDQMRLYWNRTKVVWYSSPKSFKKIAIKNYTSYCKFPRGFNWTAIPGIYHHEPKPCWKRGVDWPKLHSSKVHLGDESRLNATKPSKKLHSSKIHLGDESRLNAPKPSKRLHSSKIHLGYESRLNATKPSKKLHSNKIQLPGDESRLNAPKPSKKTESDNQEV